VIWALYIDYGFEFERTGPDNGVGYVFEWFTGDSYRFVPSWSAGLEFWNHHEFADATVHKHSAYFVGPHNSLRRPTLVRHARVSSSTANWTGFQSRKQRVRRAQQLHFGGRARKILREDENRILFLDIIKIGICLLSL